MLGERIKEIRTTKRLSQVDLAKILCVSKQSVSNWENENIQPSIEMLVKLADAFNVTTDYLLSRDDKCYLEVSGLTKEELQHIQLIISDIQRKKPINTRAVNSNLSVSYANATCLSLWERWREAPERVKT